MHASHTWLIHADIRTCHKRLSNLTLGRCEHLLMGARHSGVVQEVGQVSVVVGPIFAPVIGDVKGRRIGSRILQTRLSLRP